MSGEKLSKAQFKALERYDGAGLTAQALCRIDTFSALVRKGLLRRSYGLGPVEAEITRAGRAALEANRNG